MPTLILVGSGDIADSQAVAGALVMAISAAARIVVPDAGHLICMEKPEEFFAAVSGFLELHDPQRQKLKSKTSDQPE
jgi:pimeloyl-ACP methyl ester carboxylesterase